MEIFPTKSLISPTRKLSCLASYRCLWPFPSLRKIIMKAEVQLEIIQPDYVLNGPNTVSLRKQVQECLEQGIKLVLIDLQDVTFMDSAGLGSLVTILKSVRSAQGKLYLCSVNAQIRMLFELTGMDKVFQIYSDRAEFNQNVLSQG